MTKTKQILWLNQIKHILYRVFTNKKVLTSYCEKYDLFFRFHIRDGTGKDIYYKYGVYGEDYITTYLLNHLNITRNDLLIDVGANIGWHTLTLSKACQPTVLAFEPDPFNRSLLQENIALNNLTGIQVHGLALSNETGTQTLYLYKKYNMGRHSLIKQHNSVRSVEVPIVRLDDLLAREGMQERPIKLLKIDIEGYEFMAMQGARQALLRCENLLTEFTPDLMKQVGQDPMDYIRLIREAGFELQQIDPEGITVPDIDRIIRDDIQVNLLCRKAAQR
ncbi:FkbM family methyltransferase [Paraflavitalea pollutisoli]|uniref:FkbM family methyltransferase n=1 Tax=Paraflavitalea pollutisoli TaxID=3034143 RepID=UPI0023EDF622|nr:FkbM family methyltransferase [Paraflavitalea sp. H1-2-19X]